MQLALFDFDGTLTTGDTLSAYLRFVSGKQRYYAGLTVMSPMLAAFVLGFTPNWKAKEALIAWYLKGKAQNDLEALGQQFCKEVLPCMLRAEAIERMEWHLQQGHEVWVVSASCQDWVQPFCDAHAIGLISTQLQYQDGCFTGKFETFNCHGLEKVRRIQRELDLNKYEQIYAYGDSESGDMPMLGLANQAFFRKFV